MNKPRITAVVRKDDDGEPMEVLLYLNPEGRDLLVQELQDLNENWEHFHLLPEACTVDLPLRTKAYDRDKDCVMEHVKVLFRLDAWDEKYFPHVMSDDDPAGQ